LANDLRRDKKPCRDFIDREPFIVGQSLEGPELVERMKTGAHHILGKGILDLDTRGFDEAGDRMIKADASFCLKLLQGGEASPAGLNSELPRLDASNIHHGTDRERLQEPPTRDILREIVNAHDGSNLPDIGSRSDELGKGNLARGGEGTNYGPVSNSAGIRLGHLRHLHDGRGRTSLFPSQTVTNGPKSLLSLGTARWR
jgi:hypothetical protein